jgi:hypothetical protein
MYRGCLLDFGPVGKGIGTFFRNSRIIVPRRQVLRHLVSLAIRRKKPYRLERQAEDPQGNIQKLGPDVRRG